MIENYIGENCKKRRINHFGNSEVVEEYYSPPNFFTDLGLKTIPKSMPRFDPKKSVKIVISKCF